MDQTHSACPHRPPPMFNGQHFTSCEPCAYRLHAARPIMSRTNVNASLTQVLESRALIAVIVPSRHFTDGRHVLDPEVRKRIRTTLLRPPRSGAAGAGSGRVLGGASGASLGESPGVVRGHKGVEGITVFAACGGRPARSAPRRGAPDLGRVYPSRPSGQAPRPTTREEHSASV
jgi:hypothetical protein